VRRPWLLRPSRASFPGSAHRADEDGSASGLGTVRERPWQLSRISGRPEQRRAATELIAEAVAAYRSALTVRTKQICLRTGQYTKQSRPRSDGTGGEEQRRAGDGAACQATQAYRAALEVDTKADLPETGKGRRTIWRGSWGSGRFYRRPRSSRECLSLPHGFGRAYQRRLHLSRQAVPFRPGL